MDNTFVLLTYGGSAAFSSCADAVDFTDDTELLKLSFHGNDLPVDLPDPPDILP